MTVSTLTRDFSGLSPQPDWGRSARVAYFVSHPIQYQAPLLRKIAAQPDLDLKVFFFSDLSLRAYQDPGFGVAVQWDIPLLDGFAHEFLPSYRDRGGLGFADPLCHGIYRRLRDGRFDVVWIHGYHTLNHAQVLLAARALRLPVLLRTDSTLIDRKRSAARLLAKRVFFKLLNASVAAVLPVSQSNADYWRQYLAAVPQFPMPYAVDNDFFHTSAAQASPHREGFRERLGLQAGRPVILYASKLQTRKRCIDLVEAYLALCSAGTLARRPYLLVVGDGEERPAIEARRQQAGNPDIHLLGFRNQTELPQFFDLCDVFVLPSVWEPYGLIVNEVMNAGKAVIVSDQVGCHRDLVTGGVNGVVFKAGNVAALTEALHTVLADPERTRAMGQQSRQRIGQCSFDQDIAGLRAAIAQVVTGLRAG
jgi:glycosyltransferase involved in cell wall biosynthesis